MQLFNQTSTKEKRRILRKNITNYERILWEYLRRDNLGIRFHRQYGIGSYIADFYCPKLRIVIEVDGKSHNTEHGKEYDKVRDGYMNILQLCILRFSNSEITNDIDKVIETIKNAIEVQSARKEKWNKF